MSNGNKRRYMQATLAVAVVADAWVLVGARPPVAQLQQGLTAPHAWLARSGSDQVLVALSGAALWVVALWFAVGLAAVAASRVPGPIGRVAARLAQIALPRAVTRLCAGALGASVLLAPVAALAHPAGSAASAAPRTSTSRSHNPQVPSVPTPAWPTSTSTPAPTPTSVPTPNWPHGAPSTPTTPSTPTPPTGPAPTPGPPTTPTANAATVRVQAGDSLWLIAARRLGPEATANQITAEWQQWYAANRAVIGADPSLIHPGQVLTPPASEQAQH